MTANFPLLDQTALAVMNKFHRIFKRQNMAIKMLIEVPHHCRQGGRLAAARRSGDQQQTTLFRQQFAQRRRGAEHIQTRALFRKETQHQRYPTRMGEGAGAQPRTAGQVQRKVNLAVFLPVQ